MSGSFFLLQMQHKNKPGAGKGDLYQGQPQAAILLSGARAYKNRIRTRKYPHLIRLHNCNYKSSGRFALSGSYSVIAHTLAGRPVAPSILG